MEKYLKEELLEILPTSIQESKELSSKQKIVLGQLIIYNGLDKTKTDGYFYRSNKDLCTDCDIQEKTLITAVIKLESLGLIKRKKGDRKSGASEYRLNMDAIKDYCNKDCKTEIEDNSNNNDYSNDYSKQITAMHERINELEITVKRLVERITVIEGGNYSTDTESDIDKDKEIDKVIYNNKNNILNKDFLNKIEDSKNKEELSTKVGKEKIEELQVDKEESKDELKTNERKDSKLNQSQLDSSEIPFEVLVSTNELEEQNTADKNSYVPTDEEQYQALIKYLQPQLDLLDSVKKQEQFNYVKNTIAREGQKYIDTHEDDISSAVVQRVNKTIGTALKKKKEELSVMDLHEYLKMQHQYVL